MYLSIISFTLNIIYVKVYVFETQQIIFRIRRIQKIVYEEFCSIWRHKVLHVPSVKSAEPHIALKIILVSFMLENISLSHNSLSCSIIFYTNFSNPFLEICSTCIVIHLCNYCKRQQRKTLKFIHKNVQ